MGGGRWFAAFCIYFFVSACIKEGKGLILQGPSVYVVTDYRINDGWRRKINSNLEAV
jgi:hypothetical protein